MYPCITHIASHDALSLLALRNFVHFQNSLTHYRTTLTHMGHKNQISRPGVLEELREAIVSTLQLPHPHIIIAMMGPNFTAFPIYHSFPHLHNICLIWLVQQLPNLVRELPKQIQPIRGCFLFVCRGNLGRRCKPGRDHTDHGHQGG
jgi:hypothetical protein